MWRFVCCCFLECVEVAKRLYVDLKEDHKGNITGPVKFSEDGIFVFESLLLVMDEYAKSVNQPTHEVIADMYNYRRTNPR